MLGSVDRTRCRFWRAGRDAARMVDYWADEGVTSFKAYMSITAEELKGCRHRVTRASQCAE
jgi:hypothetical protein